MSKRKKRFGEFVCDCNAYGFPHRFGGGKCSGIVIAEKHRTENQSLCSGCNAEHQGECHVVTEQEAPAQGECLLHFIEFNEIKYQPKRK